MADRLIASGLFETLPQKTYSFRHQTFQEYLAAEELAYRILALDKFQRDEAWTFASHGLRNENS